MPFHALPCAPQVRDTTTSFEFQDEILVHSADVEQKKTQIKVRVGRWGRIGLHKGCCAPLEASRRPAYAPLTLRLRPS